MQSKGNELPERAPRAVPSLPSTILLRLPARPVLSSSRSRRHCSRTSASCSSPGPLRTTAKAQAAWSLTSAAGSWLERTRTARRDGHHWRPPWAVVGVPATRRLAVRVLRQQPERRLRLWRGFGQRQHDHLLQQQRLHGNGDLSMVAERRRPHVHSAHARPVSACGIPPCRNLEAHPAPWGP